MSMSRNQIQIEANNLKRFNIIEINKILELYGKDTKNNVYKIQRKVINTQFNSILKQASHPLCCPRCGGTHIVKDGVRNGIQRFVCQDCHKKMSSTTNTILSKSKYPIEVWVKVLSDTINQQSIKTTVNNIKKDYGYTKINPKTVFFMRHKMLDQILLMEQPQLNGVVQIDETFLRETQKGSRNLKSFIKGEDRKARKGYSPSKYGVMGNEFSCVTTAVDELGHSVAIFTSLGSLSTELLDKEFSPYLGQCTILCSDANKSYTDYCNNRGLIHYERPSNYSEYIKKNGVRTEPDISKKETKEELRVKNYRILKDLYESDLIDKLYNYGRLTYNQFCKYKKLNHLSLARVNAYHSELKRRFEVNMKNVSTKYLAKYVALHNFVHNWSVDNKHAPTSLTEVEDIFKSIMTNEYKLSCKEIPIHNKLYRTKNGKFMSVLKTKANSIKDIAHDKYLVLNEESNIVGFRTREFLFDLPKTHLKNLARKCKVKNIKDLANLGLVQGICAAPNSKEVIIKFLIEQGKIIVDPDREKRIKGLKYADIDSL